MVKTTRDMQAELRQLRFDNELLQKLPCSDQENKQYRELLRQGGTLPEGVFAYQEEDIGLGFYTVYVSELSKEETAEYLQLKQLRYLRSIRNCLVILTGLAVPITCVAVIWLLSVM